MFILMVILKHILWFSLPSECLTAGYLLSILYSLNGCEGILSYSLHKYTKITNGKRIHVYIMLFNLFLYVTIALSIFYDTYYLIFSYFINSFAAASGPLKTSQSKHPRPQESSDGTGILKYRYATGY